VQKSATAWGGGDAPTAGSKIWCSVALQPYVWDGLRGVAVSLPPDRFELVPLDERIHAAPDGSGWVARGESQMDVIFHYEVRDRATGARVLEDIATLACANRPAAKPEPPSTEIQAWANPPPSHPPDVASWALRPHMLPLEDTIPAWAYPPRHPSDDAPWPLRPPPPPLEDPRAHAISTDVRMIAAGAIFGASDVQMVLVGVQLGVGKYVADRWYVGGAARWAMLNDMGSDDSGLNSLLQVGPELRYAFHLGKGGMRVNGGPSRPIPYVDWLGLRGGVEEIGPGALGVFTDASWGSEFRIGRVDFGTVLGAGLGFDSAGAYGDSSVVHPYLDFAVRFGLNL